MHEKETRWQSNLLPASMMLLEIADGLIVATEWNEFRTLTLTGWFH